LSELSDLVARQRVIVNELEKRACEKSLAQFVKCAWHIIEPGTPLLWNWHLSTVAGYLEAVHDGRITRLIINIPPGSLKSIMLAMFGAWEWTDRPDERYLSIANAQDLSIRDALRMKLIVMSDWYQEKWPIFMQADQNEKTLFVNDKGGFRQSQGITASNTGKRGSRLLVDDPIDMRHVYSDVIRQGVNDTWDHSLSTRLNNPTKSAIILIMQRGHSEDLAGHLLKKSKTKWVHLSIPMMYEGAPSFDAGRDIGRPDLNDPRTKKGELLFPGRFPQDIVDGLMEDLGEYGTASQLQQRPVPAGGGIIKKHWWRIWPDDVAIPTCTHIFHSWDTAFSEKDSKTSAFSAMTRWGIFFHEARDRYCIMALGMWFDRVGFDELRKKVKESDKKYNPDINLVEKKATGITLVQELKRASPGKVRAYTPGRGEDKISRGHSVSPIFESGQVYAPNRMWALGDGHEKLGLIDYVAQFPNGAAPCPDLFDTVTQALIYMRSGNWSGSHDDDKDEPYEDKPRTDEDIEDNDQPKRTYYG